MSRAFVLFARVAPLAFLVVSLVMAMAGAAADPCPPADLGGC